MTSAAVVRNEPAGGGLHAVFAELRFPVPVWLLVAQAHSWGVDAECAEKLSHLPAREYRRLDEVLRALEQLTHDWPAVKARLEAPDGAQPRPAQKTPTPPRRRARGATASRAGQHKAVGEGLAVGLLALGVDAVTINEGLIESAFYHAWQHWTGNVRFPAVRTGHNGTDVVAILRGSGRRKGTHIAEWSCEGEYSPRLRVDWSLDAAAQAIGEPAGVTYEQWLELATAFAGRLVEDLGEIRYLVPAISAAGA